MREDEVTITVCNNCDYLGDCIKKATVIDASLPGSKGPRYIPVLGNDCKRMDQLLKAHEEGYEEGLNDAWETVRKLVCSPSEGGYDFDVLLGIFGCCGMKNISTHYTPKEVIEKIKAYDEANAIKRGDYVTWFINGEKNTGIVLYEQETQYWILCDDNPCPQNISKTRLNLTKLAKHIDLDGFFDGLKDKE
jgi:hypothetical protein